MRKFFFDLDGTIIDARLRLYNLFSELIPESQLSFIEYWTIKREQLGHEYILKEKYNKTNAEISSFQKEWLKKIELPEWLAFDTLIEGAVDTIKRLHPINDLYVVTARQSKQNTVKQLNDLAIINYFKDVFVTEHKMDKTSLISQSQLQLNSNDLVIGDTGLDILLAKEFGCNSIAVTSGFRSASILSKYNPDYIISSIADLKTLEIVLCNQPLL